MKDDELDEESPHSDDCGEDNSGIGPAGYSSTRGTNLTTYQRMAMIGYHYTYMESMCKAASKNVAAQYLKHDSEMISVPRSHQTNDRGHNATLKWARHQFNRPTLSKHAVVDTLKKGA